MGTRKIEGKEYTDYPDKYAKKVDWWRSENGLNLIQGWRSTGNTIKQITDLMGVDARTFRSWRKKYPEFDEAMEVSMEIASLNVVRSLYQRATGYNYVEKTYDLIEGEMRLAHEYHRHMPPDTKAILAWLYNRMPNEWRSLQEPIEQTQYTQTIKNILVSMKEVAENGGTKSLEVQEDAQE